MTTTNYKTLYFKSIKNAENFAISTGNHFESSSTQCDSGEAFCFRVYDKSLRCVYKLIVDEYSYDNADRSEQGD